MSTISLHWNIYWLWKINLIITLNDILSNFEEITILPDIAFYRNTDFLVICIIFVVKIFHSVHKNYQWLTSNDCLTSAIYTWILSLLWCWLKALQSTTDQSFFFLKERPCQSPVKRTLSGTLNQEISKNRFWYSTWCYCLDSIQIIPLCFQGFQLSLVLVLTQESRISHIV